MIKIVNIKTKPPLYYDIYIGRANKWVGLKESKWANPFVMKNEAQRDEVIKKYREYILGRQDLLDCLGELKDKTLGCWCHNDEPGHKMCHGDILRQLYEEKYGHKSTRDSD